MLRACRDLHAKKLNKRDGLWGTYPSNNIYMYQHNLIDARFGVFANGTTDTEGIILDAA